MVRHLSKLWCNLIIGLLPTTPMKFRYWDGEHMRSIDPRRPAWILEARFPPAVESEAQLSTAIRVAREAFQVAAYKAACRSRSPRRGLTDRESLELVRHFWRYFDRVMDPRAPWRSFVRFLEYINPLIQPRAK